MNEQLSALDTMFLDLEETDESAHMHIGGALVFGPLPDGTTPDIDTLREDVLDRLSTLPRFEQRLSKPHTSKVGFLHWVAAETIDVETHVRHATLPAPGGGAELNEWLGDFWSHRLDRTRPLWEMVLVDGLADGGWAMATKTHHCLVDGVGSLDLAAALLDTSPDPEPVAPPTPVEAPIPHRPRLPGEKLIRGGLSALVHPGRSIAQAVAMTEVLVREELIAAPRSSLTGRVGGTRHFATTRFTLSDIKDIKGAYGGTVNDVVLALCAGGLRHLLLARGEEPPARGLRAQVPVNVRRQEQEHDLGNQLTSLFVELPVAEPDAMTRYERIVDRAVALKRSSQPVGSEAMVHFTDAMPPVIGARLGRTLFGGTRMFNLTITNVPGPQLQLYGLGAPLREILPLVPLFAGHAIGIAVISYNGGLVFGIHADRAAAPDADELVVGIEEAFKELRPSVHRRRTRPPRLAHTPR